MFTSLSNSLQRMREVLAMYPTKQLHHYRVPYIYVGPFIVQCYCSHMFQFLKICARMQEVR